MLQLLALFIEQHQTFESLIRSFPTKLISAFKAREILIKICEYEFTNKLSKYEFVPMLDSCDELKKIIQKEAPQIRFDNLYSSLRSKIDVFLTTIERLRTPMYKMEFSPNELCIIHSSVRFRYQITNNIREYVSKQDQLRKYALAISIIKCNCYCDDVASIENMFNSNLGR